MICIYIFYYYKRLIQRKKKSEEAMCISFFCKISNDKALSNYSKIGRHLVSAEVEHTAAEGGDTGEAAGNNDGG